MDSSWNGVVVNHLRRFGCEGPGVGLGSTVAGVSRQGAGLGPKGQCAAECCHPWFSMPGEKLDRRTSPASFAIEVDPVATASNAAGGASAGVLYSASIVTKAVTINCDRDTTYWNNSGVRTANDLMYWLSPRVVDVGIGPDDSRYHEDQLRWYTGPVFARQLIGSWTDPFHIWTTTTFFSYLRSEINYTRQDSLLEEVTSIAPEWSFTNSELEEMGQFGPAVRWVRLTVKDEGGSGYQANAKTKVIIHNQFEKWRVVENLGTWFRELALTVEHPGYAVGGGGIACSWFETDSVWNAMGGIATPLFEIGVSFMKNPVYSVGLKMAGLTMQGILPRANNGTAPWAWASEGSTISGSWSDNPQDYIMYPRLDRKFGQAKWRADEYGRSGFVGVRDTIIAKEQGYRWRGNFRRGGGAQ